MEKTRFTKKELYRNFGISEWDEKCVVLNELEIEKIYSDLCDGTKSPLVVLAQLPFPKFIELYLSRYKSEKERFELDPALGYKLFMLTNAQLKKYVLRAKGAYISPVDQYVAKELRNVDSLLKQDFISMTKPTSAAMSSRQGIKQFIKLMPYIDLETARILGISNVDQLENDGINGYDFEEKMNCLNKGARYILIKYVGLYGEEAESFVEISENLKTQTKYVSKLVDLLTSLFQQPLKEFKCSLGLEDRDYRCDETREYTNRSYRDLDISLELLFIKRFMLDEKDKIVLDTLSGEQERIYLASKYMYDTLLQVANNLVVDFVKVPGLKK